eukprot:1182448-Prorocentrum_minimum.AAC.24
MTNRTAPGSANRTPRPAQVAEGGPGGSAPPPPLGVPAEVLEHDPLTNITSVAVRAVYPGGRGAAYAQWDWNTTKGYGVGNWRTAVSLASKINASEVHQRTVTDIFESPVYDGVNFVRCARVGF